MSKIEKEERRGRHGDRVSYAQREGGEKEVGGEREKQIDRQRTTPVLLFKRSYTSLLS